MVSSLSEPGGPIVEVRTPTFRRPVLLRRALSSLVAQTWSNWRCIVLDDEPGGGVARNICEELADQRIIYRANDKNLGVGRNIDQAFSLGPLPGSTHACVLEDDNYYLPDLLRDNLVSMRNYGTDIVLRNQFIERPNGRDQDGPVGPATTYDGQYRDGVLERDSLWGSFFYSTGANNSSLFWRLDRGLSFATSAFSRDPVFQERLRTLCIDRDVLIAMKPLIVWRDNGAESHRPKTTGKLSFVLAQATAAARERQLYRALYLELKRRDAEGLIYIQSNREHDVACERVLARCGIPSCHRNLLPIKQRLRLIILRWFATVLAWPVAEPRRYQFGVRRIEPRP